MLIELAAALAIAFQDTTVIRRSAPQWGENVTLTRELRIGVVDGAPEYTFGRLAGLAVSQNGNMYALDVQASTVREFDPEGRYVRSFGRRGGGPGELARPEALIIAGSRLVVRDPGNSRLNAYPLAGGPPESWSFRTSSAGPRPMTSHSDGAISTPVRIHRGGTWEDVVLRYSANGTIRDTLSVPAINYVVPALSVAAGGGGTATYTIPFVPRPTWTYLRDGRFAGGLPSRPSFLVIGRGANLRLERSAQPAAVPAEVRQEIRTIVIQNIRSANNPRYEWNGPNIPERMPYFGPIYIDSENRLWVQVPDAPRRIPSSNPGEPSQLLQPAHFEVYNPDLQYLGLVRPSPTFMFGDARGNRLWGIEADELGVQYVVRYRLNTSQR